MGLFDDNQLEETSQAASLRQRFALWWTLLETAIQTPSPHNVQPWRIRLLTEREAEFYIDGKRTLPKEDTTGSFILSTMGMFVEAIALLAAPRGFNLEYELIHAAEWFTQATIHDRKTDLLPFARLHLSPCPPRANPYTESLFLKRRTSRICLSPTAIGDTAVTALIDLANQWGQRYEQITEAEQVEEVLAQNTNALFEDLNNRAYHDEIVSWFRFTDRAARLHGDGLDWRCMNTSRTAFWLAARMPKLLSEGLRSHLLLYARSVISSFGASDLEINIAVETGLTIALRRLCLENGELCQQLFGRETPPMIFQYNPLDYTIESNAEKELLFTIGRQSGAAPKIRYNLRDSGGAFSFSALSRILEKNGIQPRALATRYSSLPLLFVYGRNDATVPFYGAKIYPADLERVINEDPALATEIHSFQLKVIEDEQLTNKLQVHLELSKNRRPGLLPEMEKLQEIIFRGLIRVNQDFREVTKMFDRSEVQVFLYEYESGPFAGRDIRIKNKYIG